MERYYTPEEFLELKRLALDLGFGRRVRSARPSSYHAHEQADSYETRTVMNSGIVNSEL
jgi:lipoate synthase